MSQGIKQKTITGMIWSSIQKFGTLGISFITNLILARLLMPEDFGVIGMLMVFLSLSDTLINGGFASALIQKKNPTQSDYSTVFYWNLVASILLYIVLFLTAPMIAKFYSMPLLQDVLRVQGLVLFLNAFNIIQNNQLIKNLNFRKLARVNIIAVIVGAIVGITMAFYGFGVWSLVVKMLVMSFAQSIILWYGDSWRPHWLFSWKSFKELFSFGSLMLLSNLSETIIFHMQSLIIGRVFSAKDLGYYTQAKNLNGIPEKAIPQIVDQVMFPVYSSMQDNKDSVVHALKTSMKSLAYITFPLMMLMAVVAEPLIVILFSDKWVDSVIYFQVFSIGSMLFALNSNNVNVVKSLGRSDFILKMTLMKRAVTLVFIFIGLKFGIVGIAMGYALSIYVWYPINVYYSKKLIGYGLLNQIKDVGFNYLIVVAIGVVTYFISGLYNANYLLKLIIDSSIFIFQYLVLTWLFKIDGYKTYLHIVNSKLRKR